MSDLISRADAIEAVCKACAWSNFESECGFSKCVFENALKALPSAETHEIRTETHGVCLISKDDAMGAVQDHFNADGFKGYDDGQKMMDRINALPSADAVHKPDYSYEADMVRRLKKAPSAEAEWIPCSERLPSESGDYLCTIPLDADETYTEVLMFHKGRFYEDDAEWGATYHDDVLAWMPLPKPYKGGDSE